MRLSTKIVVAFITISFTILAYNWVADVLKGMSVEYEEDKLKFDQLIWTSDRESRHFMLIDLLDNELKIGLDSITLNSMLGDPDFRSDSFHYYNMGHYRSGFDPTFLILEMDDNGKLVAIRVDTI